jgi:hypothetical protein
MSQKIIRSACFLATLLSSASLLDAQEMPPRPGDVKRVAVITVSLAVNSTGREVKRITYAPPPGWYVRGHRVECKEKAGLSSFTVNTLPRDWSYLSEEEVFETYRGLLDVAAKAQNLALGTKLAAEQEKVLAEVRKARSSHHVLLVEANVRGEGLFRSGGNLYLTVTADLVYVGTPQDIARVE